MQTFRSIYGNLTTSSPTKFFTTSQQLKVCQNPMYLKEYVETKYGYKKFIKGFFTESQSGYKILKRLTVVHHLILHNNDLAYIMQQISTELYSSDKWFNQNILQPYYKYLKKFSSTIDIYQKCKTLTAGCFKNDILQLLFYLINILRDLFNTVKKLQSLGRYFRQKAPNTIDSFVELITYNSQQFYLALRTILQEFIQFPQYYFTDVNLQKILKQILMKDIPQINQEMKKLFLDKYFFPFSKGYGVKLFSFQDKMKQQNQTGFVISGIINQTLNASINKIEKQNENNLLNNEEQNEIFMKSFNSIDFSQTIIEKETKILQKQTLETAQSPAKIHMKKHNKKTNHYESQQKVEDV